MQKKYLIIILLVIVNVLVFNGLLKDKHYLSSDNTISIYMNDETTSEIPSKDNSSFVKAVCDSDVDYYWDNDKWGLFIGNLSKKTKCNLYFQDKKIITIVNKSFKIDEYNKCPHKYFNYNYTYNINNLEDEYGYFCETEDDYGTSYYYRGVGTNNNVYFAGFYWQIIRINGDGSIRLLYNGTEKNAEGENKTIGKSQYNSIYDKPANAGYMYGSNLDTFENGIKNEVNSTIKVKVDKWYEDNLKNTPFEEYLTDTGFCNDRTLYSGNGLDSAIFNGHIRLINNKNPTLICPDKNNDLFTTSKSTIGNKSLTYPIGLMTADESLFAGSVDRVTLNKNSYLYSGNWYWLMTPINYAYNKGANSYASRTYSIGLDSNDGLETFASSSYYIRPVINIKADILNTGDGSSDNPFKSE